MKKNININIIINFIVVLMYILIIFSGSNIFARFQKAYFIVLAIVSLIFFSRRIIVDKTFIILSFSLLIITLSTLCSYYMSESLIFLLIFLICTIIAIFGYDKKTIDILLKVIENFSVISACIILISLVKNDLIINNLSFLFPNDNARAVTMNEIKYNIFSGIALERAYSAFCLNIGIISMFTKMIINDKKNKYDIIKLIILIAALFCCGKRTLLVIPFVIFIFLLFVNNYKKFALTIFKFMCFFIIVVYILSLIIPSVSVLLNRFLEIEKDDTYNGRIEYWEYCFEMYDENELFGTGINTFKKYISERSSLKVYHAHNIYFQLLGETGIIGFVIIVLGFILIFLDMILFLLKNKNNSNFLTREKYLLNFSLSLQILFFMYGTTGNTFYYYEQLIIYFLSIIIFRNVKKEVGKNEKNWNSDFS